MVLELLLSSLIAGPLATVVMVIFQYLPMLWSGGHYDVIGALGTAVTGKAERRSSLIGAAIHFGSGVLFAFLYGLIAWGLVSIDTELPQMVAWGGVNMFDVLIGLAVGLGHGLLVAILLAIVVVEHHPIEAYRSNFYVIPSAVVGHIAYGGSVMFFHSLILRGLFGN
ncbi:hypothetical protein BH24DEI1_BH24DEI1_04790 [soil metagenome]